MRYAAKFIVMLSPYSHELSGTLFRDCVWWLAIGRTILTAFTHWSQARGGHCWTVAFGQVLSLRVLQDRASERQV